MCEVIPTVGEQTARYKARDDWRREAVFKNPYIKGTLESIAYLSEAQKIRFEGMYSL